MSVCGKLITIMRVFDLTIYYSWYQLKARDEPWAVSEPWRTQATIFHCLLLLQVSEYKSGVALYN